MPEGLRNLAARLARARRTCACRAAATQGFPLSGLFRRLRRAPGAPSETTAAEAVAPADDPARPDERADAEATGAAGSADAEAGAAADRDRVAFHEGTAEEQETVALEPVGGSPAELDPVVGAPPTTRRRGRLRRRLRHLRRVRELLMRDLGGFVFELHRMPDGDGSDVMDAKLRRLGAVDAELRELERLLADRRALVVREPGIGGACPNCGELFGSEARFCWACGTEVAAGSGHVPELLAAHTDAHGETSNATPAEIEPNADAQGSEPGRDPEAPTAEAPAADRADANQDPAPAPPVDGSRTDQDPADPARTEPERT